MLQQSVQDIILASSLQFILSPFRSKRILIKLIWICFILLFTFLSIYYVILNILDYLKFDKTTLIETKSEFDSVEFPAISMCNKHESNFNIKIISQWFNLNQHDQTLESYNDSYYGKCYRFNGKRKEKSKKSGAYDGFWLSFTINSNNTTNTSSTSYGSLVVYIHNGTQQPTSIYNKGHTISLDRTNYFKIKRIHDLKLEWPYNECYKNASLFAKNKTLIKYFNDLNYYYTQKECLNLCYKLKYNETNKCECFINSLNEEYYKQCYNSIELKECVDKYMSHFNAQQCFDYCPMECDSFYYEIQLNTIKPQWYENEGYYYQLIVYYDDFRYTLIQQQPKIELFALISSIGGTLGLFIGFTFISILEIFEIFSEFIYIYIENKTKSLVNF